MTNAGYQMETQTRPEFTSANGLGALAYELAHQWFADHVAVRRMRDVWLSEGFATFANWLWVENTGGTTAQAAFNTQWARAANTTFWNNTVLDPGVVNQYQSATVYQRGGMTLQALRKKIGDAAFFQTLKDYVATFGGGVASTQDFIAIAQRDSGQDLRDFFKVWLYTPGKPSAAAYCFCEAPASNQTPIGGEVPATLALTLGASPGFGAFTPGIAKDYTATGTATVISTAATAALSVGDSGAVPGHLVNGTFSLPQPVQARAASAAFAPVSATPLTLVTYPNPISNDVVPLEFKQAIGATDALRTGAYAKTLTFTLSTTAP